MGTTQKTWLGQCVSLVQNQAFFLLGLRVKGQTWTLSQPWSVRFTPDTEKLYFEYTKLCSRCVVHVCYEATCHCLSLWDGNIRIAWPLCYQCRFLVALTFLLSPTNSEHLSVEGALGICISNMVLRRLHPERISEPLGWVKSASTLLPRALVNVWAYSLKMPFYLPKPGCNLTYGTHRLPIE